MPTKSIRKSVAAAKEQDTASSPAPPVKTSIGPKDRRAEISRTVGEAMKSLSAKKTMDWGRETPETIKAGFELDEAMADFVAEKATREQVKAAYKVYADLHVVEKGTG